MLPTGTESPRHAGESRAENPATKHGLPPGLRCRAAKHRQPQPLPPQVPEAGTPLTGSCNGSPLVAKPATAPPLRSVGSDEAPTTTATKLPCRASQDGRTPQRTCCSGFPSSTVPQPQRVEAPPWVTPTGPRGGATVASCVGSQCPQAWSRLARGGVSFKASQAIYIYIYNIYYDYYTYYTYCI